MPKWYVWLRNIVKGAAGGAAAGGITGGKAGAITGAITGAGGGAFQTYQQQKANTAAKKQRRKLREEEAKAKQLVDSMTPGVKSDAQLLQQRKEQMAQEQIAREKDVGPSQNIGDPAASESRKRGEEIPLKSYGQLQNIDDMARAARGYGALIDVRHPELYGPPIPAGGYPQGMAPSNMPTYADNIPGMQEALARQEAQQQQAAQPVTGQDIINDITQKHTNSGYGSQQQRPLVPGKDIPYNIYELDYAARRREQLRDETTPRILAQQQKLGMGRSGATDALLAKATGDVEFDIANRAYEQDWRQRNFQKDYSGLLQQQQIFEPVRKEKGPSTGEYAKAGAVQAAGEVAKEGIKIGRQLLYDYLKPKEQQTTVG